jgi:TusA-related sulfurtransferase
VGDVLEIWSGDARTKEDIPKWSKKVGHEFLGHLEAEGYDRITSAEANTDSPTWRRTSHPRI